MNLSDEFFCFNSTLSEDFFSKQNYVTVFDFHGIQTNCTKCNVVDVIFRPTYGYLARQWVKRNTFLNRLFDFSVCCAYLVQCTIKSLKIGF
jgi:hypothetical protein